MMWSEGSSSLGRGPFTCSLHQRQDLRGSGKQLTTFIPRLRDAQGGSSKICGRVKEVRENVATGERRDQVKGDGDWETEASGWAREGREVQGRNLCVVCEVWFGALG
eukprot:747895-Hanusia_phi.AAC.9